MTLTQQCGAAAAAQARNYGEPCVFLGSGRLRAHGGPDPSPGDEAGRRGGAASPAGAGSLFTLFLASPALALAHLLGLPDASARCAPAVAAAPPPGSLTLTARVSSSYHRPRGQCSSSVANAYIIIFTSLPSMVDR